MRAPDLRARREPPHHGEIAQRQLAHDARENDQREQHPEQQIEKVVAGVDGREADAERDAEEVLSLARELQLCAAGASDAKGAARRSSVRDA